ncbi:hypothetical protein VTK26DRAFT_6981 [Humicola hyalothermophila]
MSRFGPASIAFRQALRSTSLFAKRTFSVNARRAKPAARSSAIPGGTDSPRISVESSSGVQDVAGPASLSEFLDLAYSQNQGGQPLVFRSQIQADPGNAQSRPPVFSPALKKWFTHSTQGTRLSPYLEQHSAHILPYELILPFGPDMSSPRNANICNFLSWLSRSDDPLLRSLQSLLEHHISVLPPANQGSRDTPDTRFVHFEAPLALLIAGLQFNLTRPSPDQRFSRLYIAQSALESLPQPLRADVPVPDAVAQDGRGDVYASSIWLGLEPTNTPWHRDPNPNLFGQLCGAKAVRLMPPRQGVRLFQKVQASLGRPSANYKIRGAEMMQGPEWHAWQDAVWGEGSRSEHAMAEVVLRPSDVLYIPDEWWHSVRSVGAEGGLNGSVNWWFRRRARARASQPAT